MTTSTINSFDRWFAFQADQSPATYALQLIAWQAARDHDLHFWRTEQRQIERKFTELAIRYNELERKYNELIRRHPDGPVA